VSLFDGIFEVREKPVEWTRDDAFPLLEKLEAMFGGKYHVALAGSVAYRGHSYKDLDVIVYPHGDDPFDHATLDAMLVTAGLRRFYTVEQMHARWAELQYPSAKHVEVWFYNEKRVDIIRLGIGV
jgi:hypothetical protein